MSLCEGSWLSKAFAAESPAPGTPAARRRIFAPPELIIGAISSWPRVHLLQFSGGSFPSPQGRGIALRLSGDPGRAPSQNTQGPIPSASLCAPGEVRPFSLALCLARQGPHYCAACRRGARSRAALLPSRLQWLPGNQRSGSPGRDHTVLGARTEGRNGRPLELGSGRAPFLPLGWPGPHRLLARQPPPSFLSL